jgi:flavin-dependent dehydrogenase
MHRRRVRAGPSPRGAGSTLQAVRAKPRQRMTQSIDVVVIGGGPAGATVATLLAERGIAVTVLEKERFPRFHIGESLLPANLPLFERLGIQAQIAAISMPKYGVEFVSPWHAHRSLLEFADCWDKGMPMAYQVKRAEFDEILLKRAVAAGADVREGTKASAVNFDADGAGVTVDAVDDAGRRASLKARFLIDASGRDTFLGNKFRAKSKNPKHNSSALFAHVQGATRLPGQLEGNISIFWFEHGWFWFIPLTEGVTSVGAVCWPYYLKTRKTDLRQFFLDTVAMCPALAERMTGATLVSEPQATGNFAYSCDHTHGRNYLLLGDAYAFIDPVFSSGVYLAMNSAFAGADAVETCLREPARAGAALKRFDAVMRKGPREFSWFIYRVTNPTMRDLFMAPRNVMRVKEALLSLLAGDIFGRTPIWPSLYLFKAIYYATSIANFRRTFTAWRRRRVNIRDVEVARG